MAMASENAVVAHLVVESGMERYALYPVKGDLGIRFMRLMSAIPPSDPLIIIRLRITIHLKQCLLLSRMQEITKRE